MAGMESEGLSCGRSVLCGGGATVFGLVFGDTAGGGENEGSNLCPACG